MLSFSFKIKLKGSGTKSNVGVSSPHTSDMQFSDTN